MKGRHETLGVLYLDTQLSGRDVLGAAGGRSRRTISRWRSPSRTRRPSPSRRRATIRRCSRRSGWRRWGRRSRRCRITSRTSCRGCAGERDPQDGARPEERQARAAGLSDTEKNQGKIYDLVTDMLNFSKDRVPNVEPADVNTMVDDVVELMAPKAAEMGVALEKALSPELPPVSIDSEGIHRALLNLVTNALDAAESQPDAKVTVGTRLDDTYVRIVVLDNGVGIPAEKLPEIFKPFVSTKGARGTGLGLAGEPEDRPRAWRRAFGAEPGRGGEQVHDQAADPQSARGRPRSDRLRGAGSVAAGARLMLRAVVFDAVGTLIVPNPSVAEVYGDVGRRHGSRYRPEQAATAIRRGVRHPGDARSRRRLGHRRGARAAAPARDRRRSAR